MKDVDDIGGGGGSTSSGAVVLDSDSEGLEEFQKFLDKMDEDEDVNHVFHNAI